MLTYPELIELKEKILNGSIEIESAKSLFWSGYRESQRSWNTQDWKERRLKFLKEVCENCGDNDTLTVQHLSHPNSYSHYLREVTRQYTLGLIETNFEFSEEEFLRIIKKRYDYVPVSLCPKCKGKNPSVRVRKTPVHRCTICKYEFDHADYRTADELVSMFYKDEFAYEVQDKCFISKDKWRNRNNLANVRYWLKREIAKDKNSETIEKQALLLYLNDCIKYLSFEDAITACRKCAYSYDIKRMDLCPKCRKNYKGLQYSTCIDCLPEERRKVAFEMIEFGIEWHNMHKRLGID